MKDPFPLMERLAREYADPLTCPLPGQAPMVLTFSQAGVRAVFSADPDTFEPGAPEALAAIVGKGSIFLKKGEDHRRARKLLMPPFHGDRMRAYAELMQAVSERWLATVPLGQTRPILPTFQGITLDIIVEAVFGARQSSQVETLRQQILAIVEAFNPLVATFSVLQKDFWGIGPWAKLQRASAALRGTIDGLIEQKTATPGEDILSLLLGAEEPPAREEIYEQLLSFVVAGHETTATTLAFALYELGKSEASLLRLEAELASLDSPERLAQAPYLRAVVSEVLRLHPPVPIVSRRCVRPFQLGQYLLPPGQSIGAAVYMSHIDPSVFPEPFTFRPERFLDQPFSPFLYYPFGGGARRCIGAAFASYELAIVLGNFVQKARFRLEEPKPVRSVFRIGTFGPETGVRITRLPAA